MKSLILFGAAFLVQMAVAQTCKPISKEMGEYQAQKDFSSRAVREGDLPAIQGFVDSNGRFLFDDFSRGGLFAAKLNIDRNNTSYKEFIKVCSGSGRGSALRNMRRTHENNRYTVTLRYLPALTGFANVPQEEQNLKEWKSELSITYADKTILDQEELNSKPVKAEFYAQIERQLRSQKELGSVVLDLTGWDDIVCDLVQGRATITWHRTLTSLAPLVTMQKKVEPNDMETLYNKLNTNSPVALSKEQLIFQVGRKQLQLEHDHVISSYDEPQSFKMAQSLMNPEMTAISSLSSAEISCITDRMQSYSRPEIEHQLHIQFEFDPTDVLKGK